MYDQRVSAACDDFVTVCSWLVSKIDSWETGMRLGEKGTLSGKKKKKRHTVAYTSEEALFV